MRTYVYPKVPHHYHESVSDSFFESDDLIVVEKLDGSNARLVVYDSQYSELYPDEIHSHNPSHGDVFIFSKKAIRGRLSDSLETIDGAFHRLVRFLRDTFNTSEALSLHNLHHSPLVFFGEHMLQHSLNYDYSSNPPPALVGFDILKMNAYSTPPPNPFNERFDAFLPFEDTEQAFSIINIPTTPVISQPSPPFDTDSFTFPNSTYTDGKVEGVVIRSDSRDRRVKYVSPEFRERMQQAWGPQTRDADTPEEQFIAQYITPARIRKTIYKALTDTTLENIDVSVITDAVIYDAWTEELADIKTFDEPINPSVIPEKATPYVSDVFERLQTNAELNETSVTNIWTEFTESVNGTVNTDSMTPSVPATTIESVTSQMNVAESPEYGLVTALLSRNTIYEAAKNLAREENRSMGNWVIEPLRQEMEDEFWYTNIDVISQLPSAFTPRNINYTIAQYVAKVITKC